jgi:hypothetical protein
MFQLGPTRRQIRVVDDGVPSGVERPRRVQDLRVALVPLGGVAVPLEIEGGQPEVTFGESLGDSEHALVHEELTGEEGHPSGDGWRERAKYECDQHHDLDDAGAELEISFGQGRRELIGFDRRRGQVGREAGHGDKHRTDQGPLRDAEALVGRHGTGHSPGQHLYLVRAR